MNTPQRLIEAPWVYRGGRYVKVLYSLRAPQLTILFPLPYIFLILQGSYRSFGIVLLVVVGLFLVWMMTRRRKAAWFVREHYRAADPQRPDELGMVVVSFRFKGAAYGEDLGFLSIDDHYFHFEGTQTSFSVAGLRAESGDGLVFGLRDAPGYSIAIHSLAGHKRLLPDSTFPSDIDIVRRWSMRTDDPDASYRIGLPPLRPPHPSPPRIRRLQVLTATLLAMLAIGVVVWFECESNPVARILIVIGGSAYTILALHVVTSFRASYGQELLWADRPRLPIEEFESRHIDDDRV